MTTPRKKYIYCKISFCCSRLWFDKNYSLLWFFRWNILVIFCWDILVTETFGHLSHSCVKTHHKIDF